MTISKCAYIQVDSIKMLIKNVCIDDRTIRIEYSNCYKKWLLKRRQTSLIFVNTASVNYERDSSKRQCRNVS